MTETLKQMLSSGPGPVLQRDESASLWALSEEAAGGDVAQRRQAQACSPHLSVLGGCPPSPCISVKQPHMHFGAVPPSPSVLSPHKQI